MKLLLKNVTKVFFLLFIELFTLCKFSLIPEGVDLSYLFLGLFSFFYLIKDLNSFKPSFLFFYLNLISLFLYLSYPEPGLLNMFLFLLLILTAFFISLNIYIVKNNPLRFLVLFPLTLILVIYPFLNDLFWVYLCTSTCRIVHKVITLIGYKDVLLLGDYRIGNDLFKISIYSPCSGLEGISFYISAFSFFLIVSENRLLKPVFVVPGYILGIFSMIVLNVIRITSFFAFGVYISKTSGSFEGAKAAVNLFHSNIGWVLYTIGITAFISLWLFTAKKLKIISA